MELTKKEIKKIQNARYRKANKVALKEKRDNKREELKAYSAEYYLKNNRQFKTRYYDDKIDCYVVSIHCDGGYTYVGSGTNLRPQQKQGRSAGWKEAFKDGFEVEVLFKCKTKEEAKAKEIEVINLIGINNLVNIHTK